MSINPFVAHSDRVVRQTIPTVIREYPISNTEHPMMKYIKWKLGVGYSLLNILIGPRNGALIYFSGMKSASALFSQPGVFGSFVGTKEQGSRL